LFPWRLNLLFVFQFNLSIPENADILSATRAVVEKLDLTKPFTLHIRIDLRDGPSTTLPLEIWTISNGSDWSSSPDSYYYSSPSSPPADNNRHQQQQLHSSPVSSPSTNRMMLNIYNGLSLMIKSLLCLTRVTPIYKIARQASSSTYSIEFNISKGTNTNEELFKNTLGHKLKHIPMGKVSNAFILPVAMGILFYKRYSLVAMDILFYKNCLLPWTFGFYKNDFVAMDIRFKKTTGYHGNSFLKNYWLPCKRNVIITKGPVLVLLIQRRQ
jgi:hypothetical protein